MKTSKNKQNPFFLNIIPSHDITFDDFHENKTSEVVSPWVVRRRDILYIVNFFKETGCSFILDIGCGQGFLSSLIAMEGLPVTGIDICDNVDLSYFNHSLLTLTKGDIYAMENSDTFDGVFISWPNKGCNFSPAINRIMPRAVVFSIETSGMTGDRDGRYLSDLLPHYRPIIYWDNVNYKDVNSTLYRIISSGGGDLVPDLFKTSHNRIVFFLRREMDAHRIIESLQRLEKKDIKNYPWESDIDKFYRVNEYIGTPRKILWKMKPIINEVTFLREMIYSGIIEKGLVV